MAEKEQHGITGDKLAALLRDGSDVQLVKNLTRSMVASGPEQLEKVSASLITRATKQEAKFRALLGTHGKEISAQVRSAPRNSDGRITRVAARRIRRLARARIAQATKALETSVQRNTEAAVRTSLRAQVALLRGKGLDLPSRKTVDKVAAQIARQTVKDPYPGTEANVLDRLGGHGVRLLRQVNSAITADEAGTDAALGRMQLAFQDPTPGRTRVVGGSASKAVAQINRSEQSRAVQTANLLLYEETGILLAYWRLNPRHPWRGGKEFCEKLAASTGPGVNAVLQAAEVSLTLQEKRGLYLVTRYPFPPHPHCMCYQEAMTF